MKYFNLLNHIKLPYRMLFIAVLASISIAIPSVYFYQSGNAQETMATAELAGIKHIRETITLAKVLAEHRGVSARAYGGEVAAEALRFEKSSNVDVAFDILDSQLRQSELMELNVEVRNLKRRWDSLKANVTSRAIDADMSFESHSQLILEVSEFTSSLMRHFLLAYDPQAVSYHLIIANFQDLPRLANSLGKVRGKGAQLLARGSATQQELAKLEGFINSVDYPSRDFTSNLKAAADSDIRFTDFSDQAKEFAQHIQQLINLSNVELLDKQNFSYPSNVFFDEFTQVINEMYDTQGVNIGTLEMLLNERIDRIRTERFMGLIVIATAFALCLLFGFLIVGTVLNAVQKLQQRFNQISSGDFSHTKASEFSDEFGKLSTQLSALTQHLADAKIESDEAFRVKQSLDSSSTPFLLSDQNHLISYANSAALKLFKVNEATIKTSVAHFSSQHVIGQSFDVFLNAANIQHNTLSSLETEMVKDIRLGELDIKLTITPIFNDTGELSGYSNELYDMTSIYEEERKTRRILESLNCTSTNVMIADASGKIIYLNGSVQKMLRECESDFRVAIPHFDASKVLNHSIDLFHSNMSHQQKLLENLKTTHEAQIKVGLRHFKLIANPIFSAQGERLGTVTEWLDRTKEVIAQQEIENMVQSALNGDFTYRVSETDKQGFLLNMAKGLNSLVGVTEKGLNEVADVLLAFANGDLTKRVENDYHGTFHDLKVYCNQSSENLTNMIQRIRESAETINMASNEIAQGNVDLSSRTEEQASSLEQTASTMDEITGTVRMNAQNAEKANLLSSDASSIAYHGGDLIQQVVNAMADIDESAQKIANIISVIDSLAFQTNILALNAAVEAARAGEQGRGFAVVASEVRTLAQRSAEAAKDIKNLISSSVERVGEGNKLVHESGETMKEIVVAIQKVNDIMSDIASASNEQALSIDEISHAITQMDEMTQQNAALVEEAAASSESLRSQSDVLTQSVFTFKLNDIADMPSQPLDWDVNQKRENQPKSGRLSPSKVQDDEWESF